MTTNQKKKGGGRERKDVGAWTMGGSNYKRVIELEDLLMRLRAIDKEMPQDAEADAGADKKKNFNGDRFLELKSEFLEGMTELSKVRAGGGRGWVGGCIGWVY